MKKALIEVPDETKDGDIVPTGPGGIEKAKLVSALTAADILDILTEWFKVKSWSAQAGLWAILSALRGPDNQDGEAKLYGTDVVRGLTFPLWRDKNIRNEAPADWMVFEQAQEYARSYMQNIYVDDDEVPFNARIDASIGGPGAINQIRRGDSPSTSHFSSHLVAAIVALKRAGRF